MENINIELDETFLKQFFELTDKVIPDGQQITLGMLRQQVEDIKNVMSELKENANQKKPYVPAQNSPTPANTNAFFNDDKNEDTFNLPKQNILIIDDLGVITYQLEVLFKQQGFNVITSKEIYDAIEKFKKQAFDFVIMDLFIPTEREGFILLEELKKVALNTQKQVKIGVMSASSKKEHKQLCKMKGAEFYIEKIEDWQKELIRCVQSIK